MVSKALVVGAYQRKAEEIAALGVDLTVLVPPAWHDRRGKQVAQRQHTRGYDLRVIPLQLNGNYHLHYYPTLTQEFARLQPQLVHMDEEPYNLATWLGLRSAQRLGAVPLFFTWQNIDRRYPIPFRWLAAQNYARAAAAIAGNQDAATILRRKGYRGPIIVLPQFGVDPAIFAPPKPNAPQATALRIGYAGGLLPEKGVDLLLHACAGLQGDWRLAIAGQGGEAKNLHALATNLAIADKVKWVGSLDSSAMPRFYQNLDLLVLPSRSLPNWREQFGRVLMEAMACEVAVVGSASGEIPHVIGDAGLIFPENDIDALRTHLQQLLAQPERCRQLGRQGRNRVQQHFTMARIAAETVQLYQQCLQMSQKQARGR
ncbi:MAG: glycosyltransferase family 4 protein [Caldilineaceae bacterium]